ncbi:alpha/beta fold hydrolase [Acidimicrobiaceae bacterium USS-CC1]|uniref:Alpha/beta fold hydrolase n=1 Tax=Acidiferrimicrobium australe TaxID=2664430 RepID=A0ABW9QS29_9ACTN|nr:alpha/beta fold hydrolase [Acidiferrimicrobium australe]
MSDPHPADAATDPGRVEEVRLEATGGVRLAVRVRHLGAPGVPMLLVHGLASNARLWDGVAAELADRGHPVAAVDQRGHGHSDKPDDGYDFGTLTADLLAVIDGLGWRGRPVLAAGQSWGGNVVVELGARHPGAVHALALVDGGTIELSAGFADWPTAEAALTPPQFAGTPRAEFEAALRRAHPDWPESGIEGALGNVEVLADGTVRPWLTLPRHLAILRSLWQHHPLERMAAMQVPVLLVPAGDPRGRASRHETVKREATAAAAAALPTGAVRWIDGDHDLHAQYPAEIAALLVSAADGSAFA